MLLVFPRPEHRHGEGGGGDAQGIGLKVIEHFRKVTERTGWPAHRDVHTQEGQGLTRMMITPTPVMNPDMTEYGVYVT